MSSGGCNGVTKKKFCEALIAKYDGMYREADAHLHLYMTNPVGIGEHSDLLEECDKFVKQIVEWKKEVNDKHAFFMSVNILRFPSFQSVTMLPQTIKEDLANRIEKVMKEEYDWINDLERNQLKRLLIYLRRVDSSMEDVDAYSKKRNDLINFVDQYAVRRNKPIEEYMPKEFNDWYQELKNGE